MGFLVEEKDNWEQIFNNDGVITKVGHLYENIKFDCDNDVSQIIADFHNEFLKIIKDASHRDYNTLNQLIDNTFDADIEVLESRLKDNKNMLPENKKKFFFDEKTGEIISNFTDYIKIIYMERILFDFLSIGLNDLTNNSIKKILKSKQENRIDNFIASMTNDEVIIPRLSNGFKTDYTGRVQDKKNFLRYLIYFHYLKGSLSAVQKDMRQLELYRDTKEKILNHGKLVNQEVSKLKNLRTEIVQLEEKIKLRQEELDKPRCLLEQHYKSQQKSDQKKLKDKQAEKNKLDKKLIWLKHVHFVSEKYGNELKSAQHILKDIQKNWENAFHQFIYLHMLENPDKITKLKKRYGLSIWGFMDFLLKRNKHPNFNRALYEIDKAKGSKDFQDEEGDKRTKILQNVQLSINNLNENQRKLVNDLFNNGYSDDLENSWMRKAFWILFAGISLFVVIATAPLLAIIIPDIIMGLGTLTAVIIGAALVILLFAAAASGAGSDIGSLPLETPLKFLLYTSWHDMPWLTFNSISISAYYASTFFSVAIPIATVILIAAIAFYIYKKRQFNSMIEVPNLQIQQEKPPLEQRLERFKEQSAKENLPETGKDQNNLDYNASNKRLT